MAGRVNNIDPMIAPMTGGCGRGNRDASLLLLHHPVHRRGTLMHFADLVVNPGVVKNPLGGGRFPRVDVRHDPDVAGFL